MVRKVALVVALLALTACGEQVAEQDDRICLNPSDAFPPPGTALTQVAEACIHKWSYRLAGAPGSNKEVAEAVVAGCEEPILINIDQANSEHGKDANFYDLVVRAQAQKSALFHVTQARAGRCAIP
jgi:hypothetical protein